MRVFGKGFSLRTIAGLAVSVVAMLAAPALFAQDNGSILYHEPLQLLPTQAGRSEERLVFDALGRRFELTLTPNARLQRRRERVDYDLLRGHIDGQPDSWVRLTRRGDKLAGMFFDGDEHYAIEPWAEIAGYSITGGDNAGATNAVYRLRDVLLPAGAASCGPAVPSAAVRGDIAFAELNDELGGLPTLEAQGANRRIELRAVADYEFFQAWGITSEAEILSRMNIVDGIFSSQLGLEIDVAAVEVFQTAADPFTTDVPGDLLDEVVDYRVSRATGEGLTHLFTWRDLQGTTRGIAYLSSACMTTFAAALSQQVGSSLTFGSLIAAHEIGHNLSAQHDGEVSTDPLFPNACDTVPQTFLMAPTITGSDQFSQCSIDTITNYLNTLPTSCVTGIGPFLDGVPANLPAVVDTPTPLNFRVINQGGAATGVELSLTYPASLDVQPQNVACTLNQGSALCTLGDLADGEQVPLSFELQSPAAGNFAMIVALATDLTPDADRATITINVQATATVQGSGGGGGGGALGPGALVLLLSGCLALRRGATRW